MNRRTKALQFKPDVKRKIIERDHGCIFCQIGFYMNASDDFQYRQLDIMHIMNRSQGGLGIEQNGVTGCRYHHQLLDNGSKGLRPDMIRYIEEYMKRFYPEWDKEKLTYHKYGCY
nr:MAG TPA: endonuclease [Caudoviricetes sp.]